MATDNVNLFHGDPIMVDHTPSGAVAAGEVVVTADTPRIAHRAIAANELGALAFGGGVYTCPKATGTGQAIAANTLVYWNASGSVVTTTASSHKKFGYTVEASGDDDATCKVVHWPQA